MTEAQKGHVAMLSFSMFVAVSFILGGKVAPLIDPMALNATRFAIAAAIMGSIAVYQGNMRRENFTAPWRYLLLGGLFCTYFVLMFVALKTASPVSTSAVFTLTPIMTAGFGWLLMRQVMTSRMALALAIAGAGAVWVIFGADWQALLNFRVGEGEVIFFFGCIAHAIYTPMVPKMNRGEPVVGFTFGVLFAAMITLGIVGFDALRTTDWANLPTIVWVTIFYLAIFASSLTFFLIQFAAMRLPSAKVMAYTYLVPVWVIVIQGAMGSGWPPVALLAGVSMVLVGLFMLLKD